MTGGSHFASTLAPSPSTQRSVCLLGSTDALGTSILARFVTVRDPLETFRYLRIRELSETPVPTSNNARGTPQGRCRRSTKSTAPARKVSAEWCIVGQSPASHAGACFIACGRQVDHGISIKEA